MNSAGVRFRCFSQMEEQLLGNLMLTPWASCLGRIMPEKVFTTFQSMKLLRLLSERTRLGADPLPVKSQRLPFLVLIIRIWS